MSYKSQEYVRYIPITIKYKSKKQNNYLHLVDEEAQDFEEIKQTWRKLEYIAKKAGLRDGISTGRESNFQEYFDMGFKEGFKNGYALGKYKGSLTAHFKRNSSDVGKYPIPEKTSRAVCNLCFDEETLDEDVPEIIRKQTEVSDKHLHKLYSTFDPTEFVEN